MNGKKYSTLKDDKFSTPARRRRIVADAARNDLKKCYRQVCENIAISRRRNAAVLIIQCFFRVIISYRIQCGLRNRKLYFLAILIQCQVRIFLARERVQDLRWNRIVQLKKRSAVSVQCAWRSFVAKRQKQNLLLKKELYRLAFY
jgi:hypothetical protein